MFPDVILRTSGNATPNALKVFSDFRGCGIQPPKNMTYFRQTGMLVVFNLSYHVGIKVVISCRYQRLSKITSLHLFSNAATMIFLIKEVESVHWILCIFYTKFRPKYPQ